MPCGLPRHSPQIATLTSDPGAVNSVAFSPDGKTLATGDADGTARLWNLATGQPDSALPARRLPAPSRRWRSARTARSWPPATTMARPGCGTWPPAADRPALHGDAEAVSSVAFSPDGKTLASRLTEWPGPAVGRGDRPPDRAQLFSRSERDRRLGGVQPGRQDAGHRRLEWPGPAVGRGDRPPGRARLRAAVPPMLHVGGVQPGRQDPGNWLI